MSSTRARHRIRRLAPVLAVSGAIALSGCQVLSPLQTQVPYIPADGIPVNLGEVEVRNLVIVADEKDGPGTVTGSVNNPTNTVQTITFEIDSAKATASVDPYSEVSLSMGAGKVTLDQVPAAPGDLVNVNVSTPSSGVTPADVPVLPSYEYYESYAPSGE
jgi:hypothetical protein